jgi:hypothetical protein
MITRGDLLSFREELETWVSSLVSAGSLGVDLNELGEKTGIRFPLGSSFLGVDDLEEWDSLCYICFWLFCEFKQIPDEFRARMTFGPKNVWAALLLSGACTKK